MELYLSGVLSTIPFDLLVLSVHNVGSLSSWISNVITKCAQSRAQKPLSRIAFYCSPAGFDRSWCPLLHTLSPLEPPERVRGETIQVLNQKQKMQKWLCCLGQIKITKRPMKNFLMPDMAAGAGSSWCFLGASATVACKVHCDLDSIYTAVLYNLSYSLDYT